MAPARTRGWSAAHAGCAARARATAVCTASASATAYRRQTSPVAGSRDSGARPVGTEEGAEAAVAMLLTNYSPAEGVRENATVGFVTLPSACGYVLVRVKGTAGCGVRG
jgi:hypothetical protein